MDGIQGTAAQTLQQRWTDLVGGADQVAHDLLARYHEPHRRYHNADHLLAVLGVVDDLAADADDVIAVRLAAWFHDAVYDPARADNEERSARLAERSLADAGLPAQRTAEVARLVRVTADATCEPGDRNAAVLCDADLSVLGRPSEHYGRYSAAVREEYAFVPEEAFRGARAAVLRELLAAPVLFHTRLGHARYEEQARRNLRAELDRLDGGVPHQQS